MTTATYRKENKNMKTTSNKKTLKIAKQTLKNLTVKTGVRAGACPTSKPV